jgi:16S rRNA G527 N7-methylase RsmG
VTEARTKQDDIDLFISWFLENYPHLSDEVLARLLLYGELLREASGRKGLVARGDRPHLLQRHFREVLAPPLVERLSFGARGLDVGSGGGLPGIPLAVLRPDLTLTLLEPRQGKVQFLERAALVVGVADRVTIIPATLEEMARGRPAARFDVILSRAVKWSASMVLCVEQISTPEATLIRFGSPDFSAPGVESIPLGGASARAIQIWGREAWSILPSAE